MDAIFSVTRVLGGCLIGDLEPAEGVGLQFRKNREIRIFEITAMFERHGGPKLHDLTDYFRVGDRFGVALVAENIIQCGFDVKQLRDRRWSFPVPKDPSSVSSLGYVVSANAHGFLIWSKIDGGTLVFAPTASICFESFPPKTGLERAEVAIMAKKKDLPYHGPYFMVPRYECTSTLLINDDKTMPSYFPTYRRLGKICCVLDECGAIFVIEASETVANDFVGTVNTNRALPQEDERVFCPAWAFSAAESDSWKAYCRLGCHYEMRIVFIRDRSVAYNCHWVAIAVKILDFGLPSAFQTVQEPSPAQRKEAHDLAKQHDAYLKSLAKRSDWNAAEARRRIVEQLQAAQEQDRAAEGDGARAGSDFEANCRHLLEFMKEPRAETPTSEVAVSSRRFVGGKELVGSGAQTTLDSRFFDQLHGLLIDLTMQLHPNELEEFWSRFRSLDVVMKK